MIMASIDLRHFSEDNIRNVCILAHVDHGKTSIADSLLSINGLINKRGVGTIRYLDDRRDEQERKITMKSSAISLTYMLSQGETTNPLPVLVNLVDTPGHIDFSSEVTAAIRICDGALIVVDVVEGVCSQTKVALKQAYDEKLQMILIVNKIDRLILDLKQNPKEMFLSILRVIEDCNAYLATLYQLDGLSQDEASNSCDKPNALFSPVIGNVIFGSAIDGWGFTLKSIAKTFINILKNIDEDTIINCLWNFDCFISTKDKQIKYGAVEKDKSNFFTQLVTTLLHNIYTTIVINKETEKVSKIVTKLGLKDLTAHRSQKDFRLKLKTILEAWQPLPKIIVSQCFLFINSPKHIEESRIHYLINSDCYLNCTEIIPHLENVILAYQNCSREGPSIAYISKLLVINKSTRTDLSSVIYPQARVEKSIEDKLIIRETSDQTNVEDSPEDCDNNVIAVVRIFSGTLFVGQELYVLNTNYNPIEYLLSNDKQLFVENNENIKKIIVTGVYILMGRTCKSVPTLGSGYICGISGVQDIMCHMSTLSTSLLTPPIIEQNVLKPIAYNVISPINPNDMSALKNALCLLQQNDSCAKVILNKSGAFLLVTAGDVHLEKCLEDLRNRFGNVEFSVSSQIYPLRETIIQTTNVEITKIIELADNFKISMKMMAIPIFSEIANVIKTQHIPLKIVQSQQMPSAVDIRLRYKNQELRESSEKIFKNELSQNVIANLKQRLTDSFNCSDKPWNTMNANNIWQIGDARDCTNLLLNCIPNYDCNIFITPDECDNRVFINNYIINAFNVCCSAGVLCDEPLMHCAFLVVELELTGDINVLVSYDPQLANALTQQLRAYFKDCLLEQNMVLMEPLLVTNIQTDVQGIGKLYSEVHKRCGKITEHLNLDEQNKYFHVTALIPAVESEGFANDIRKISSGGANPSLFFSHYEIVDSKIEESSNDSDEDNEENETISRAQKLIKQVRHRKGLLNIDDQVVISAEKQRTLKK